ncbi:Mitogen-activated protein kinase 5 [Diplonema papillatum]|nr:Mitogen-activated protein kinase 5 [Diplonema papillatum]
MACTTSGSRVAEPRSLPDGRKEYVVQGSKFLVDAKYCIKKSVGCGAYGIVCAAVNTETNERVAIKKIGKVFDDLVDGKRILRELKLLTFLDHENIIGIRDVLHPPSKHTFEDIYLVTELMDTDLHQVIRSKQELTDEHHKYLMYQAIRALKYIHSANVLHRDLKPQNLLLNAQCDLLICDFGLARGFDDRGLTDYVVTRWYRPPELLLGSSQYSPAVDMWSIGCILAELINRKPLFPGRDYLHQLNIITDALGTPCAEDVGMYRRDDQAASYLRRPRHPIGFRKLIPQARFRLISLHKRLLRRKYLRASCEASTIVWC